MDNELLVKTIRTLCKDNNISVSQLENDLNFGAGLISRWIKSSPSLDKIIDIADYFHVTIDEVVGYNQNIDDEFLKLLCEKTEDGSVVWNILNDSASDEIRRPTVDYWSDPFTFQEYIERYIDIRYYTTYSTGYISICCLCLKNDTLNPTELNLFIQPTKNSSTVEQKYSTEELKPLWIKILKSIGTKAPDDVQVEDFKNSFINEFNKPKPQKHTNNIILVPNKNNKQLEYVTNYSGCIMYNIISDTEIDSDETVGITQNAKDFYYKHKETLGKVKQAHLKNGKALILMSERYFMKLSGFSWGKECGSTGYNGLIEILSDAGFDIDEQTISNKKNIFLVSGKK